MKYAVKMVATNPCGETDKTEYWLADNEAEMHAMIGCQRELSYTGITCLGPIVEPSDHMKMKIAAYQEGLVKDE